MNVLSVHYGHNSTAGLSVNGKIVSIISEERICRLKNATGFPSSAIKEIVKTYLDDDLSKIDIVTFIDKTGSSAKYLISTGLHSKTYLDYYWKKKSSYKNDQIYL